MDQGQDSRFLECYTRFDWQYDRDDPGGFDYRSELQHP